MAGVSNDLSRVSAQTDAAVPTTTIAGAAVSSELPILTTLTENGQGLPNIPSSSTPPNSSEESRWKNYVPKPLTDEDRALVTAAMAQPIRHAPAQTRVTPEDAAIIRQNAESLQSLAEERSCLKSSSFWLRAAVIIASVVASILMPFIWQAAIAVIAVGAACMLTNVLVDCRIGNINEEGRELQRAQNSRVILYNFERVTTEQQASGIYLNNNQMFPEFVNRDSARAHNAEIAEQRAAAAAARRALQPENAETDEPIAPQPENERVTHEGYSLEGLALEVNPRTYARARYKTFDVYNAEPRSNLREVAAQLDQLMPPPVEVETLA